MRHRFQTEQWVPFPVDFVFAFFANPENLPPLMPRWQAARIEEASFVSPPPRPATPTGTRHLRSFAAGAGSTITISFRPFPLSPVRMPWEAYIADFAWNNHFCDEQVRGPFAYWRHCHHVAEELCDQRPGTLIRDDLTYEMRFGKPGEMAHTLLGRAQIENIFAYRQKRLAEILPKIAAQFNR